MKRNDALKSLFSARFDKTKTFSFQVFKPFRIVLRRIGFEKVRIRILHKQSFLTNLTQLLKLSAKINYQKY